MGGLYWLQQTQTYRANITVDIRTLSCRCSVHKHIQALSPGACPILLQPCPLLQSPHKLMCRNQGQRVAATQLLSPWVNFVAKVLTKQIRTFPVVILAQTTEQCSMFLSTAQKQHYASAAPHTYTHGCKSEQYSGIWKCGLAGERKDMHIFLVFCYKKK